MTDAPAAPDALFVFGTLCHGPLLAAVLGREVALRPAMLAGYRAGLISGETYPGLVTDLQGHVAGFLVRGLSAEDFARLDFYELGSGYERVSRRVTADDREIMAELYQSADTQPPLSGPWDLAAWEAVHAAATVIAAGEFMALMGRMPPEAAMARGPQMLVRATSALRAASAPAPRAVRSALEADQVAVEDLRRPYTEFFALREHVLRFPLFGGGMSAPVRRAGLVAGDAVTVLPWDPVRDRVLLVEQFRYGPYLRGDPRPWGLEPVAGRIDPGEDPEEAARREAREEAGLEIGALHRIGAYYPSPGALTEWLVSYIGIADLPDGAGIVAGVEDEAEDIKGHVIALDRLLELLETEEAANAPLILSALWLARHRERLRGGGAPHAPA